MKDNALEGRIGQLVAEAVNAALNSQLGIEQAIACFGLASKILMQQAAVDVATLDPHTAFAKGLAQMADIKAGGYH